MVAFFPIKERACLKPQKVSDGNCGYKRRILTPLETLGEKEF